MYLSNKNPQKLLSDLGKVLSMNARFDIWKTNTCLQTGLLLRSLIWIGIYLSLLIYISAFKHNWLVTYLCFTFNFNICFRYLNWKTFCVLIFNDVKPLENFILHIDAVCCFFFFKIEIIITYRNT